MEQEAVVEEKGFRAPDPLTIVQKHLNKISEALKENTVALVEMGVMITKLVNSIEKTGKQ